MKKRGVFEKLLKVFQFYFFLLVLMPKSAKAINNANIGFAVSWRVKALPTGGLESSACEVAFWSCPSAISIVEVFADEVWFESAKAVKLTTYLPAGKLGRTISSPGRIAPSSTTFPSSSLISYVISPIYNF